MTEGELPNDRGCRSCGKIGHLVKDCPRRKAYEEKRKRELKQQRQQRQQVKNKEEQEKGKSQLVINLSRDFPLLNVVNAYKRLAEVCQAEKQLAQLGQSQVKKAKKNRKSAAKNRYKNGEKNKK